METITRALLNQHLPAAPDRQILDAGCGTGVDMTHFLPAFGSVTGFDVSARALELCQIRGLKRLARAHPGG